MSHILEALEVTVTADRRRVDFAAGCLVGAACGDCGWATWPQRALCARCGSAAMSVSELRGPGELSTWTTVWTSLPDVPAPYSMGLLMVDGIRIFGHLRGDLESLHEGSLMRLVVNEGSVPPYWFETIEEAAA